MGGRAGDISHPERWAPYSAGRPTAEISVALYHQILLCPFSYALTTGGAGAALARAAQEIVAVTGSAHSVWRDATAFESRAPLTTDFSEAAAYAEVRHAEYLYFHPFVRRFLYSSNEGGQALKRLVRDDVRWALLEHRESTPSSQTRSVVLRVRRVEIYLFDTGTGVFVVELDNRLGPHRDPALPAGDTAAPTRNGREHDIALGRGWNTGIDIIQAIRENLPDGDPLALSSNPLTLADVLWIQDELRRLYAPYWVVRSDGASRAPGHGVDRVRWFDASGCELLADGVTFRGKGSPVSAAGAISVPLEETQTATTLFEWWRRLMWPLAVGRHTATQSLSADLLGDERMGVMTYLALADVGSDTDATNLAPRQIGDADWMRLAMQEPAGDHDRFPFAPGFFHGGDDEASAVRAFNQRYTYDRHYDPRGAPPAQKTSHNTRYLLSGMGFVAVSRFAFRPAADRGGLGEPDFGIDPVHGLLAHFRYHYFKIGLIVHAQRATLLRIEDALTEALRRFRGAGSADAERRYAEDIDDLSMALSHFRSTYWFTELSGHIQGQEIYDRWSGHLRLRELFEQVTSEVGDARALLQSRQERALADSTWRVVWLATYFAPFVLLSPFILEWSHAKRGWQVVAVVLISASGLLLTGIPLPDLRQRPRRYWWLSLLLSLAALIALLVAQWGPWEFLKQPARPHASDRPTRTATPASAPPPSASPTERASVMLTPTAAYPSTPTMTSTPTSRPTTRVTTAHTRRRSTP